MSADLPTRVRLQLALTRKVAAVLRRLGVRDLAVDLLQDVKRARRLAHERAGSERLSTPALYGMDRALDRIIAQRDGIFLEAGGFDGYTQSNTYFLERFRGWRGILVEPVAALAAQARRNRPGALVIHGALVGHDYPESTVSLKVGDLMTTVSRPGADTWASQGLVLGWRDAGTVNVPARTLSSIIEEAGGPPIDLLSLDVEGYEEQALAGLDLDRHAPRWILVEMLDQVAGRARIGAMLAERYVEHVALSPLDVLYRRADVPSSPD